MGKLHTTRVVPERERLGFWKELVRNTYVPLEVSQRGEQSFYGEIFLEPLGCLDLSMLNSCGQHAARTSATIARSSADYFFVIGQVKGRGTIRQDARETVLDIGGWSLIDTERPYDLIFDGPFQQLVVSVPRAAVPNLMKASRVLTGRDLSRPTALGSMFSNYLALLAVQARRLSVETRPLLADSILNLLAATVGETLLQTDAVSCPESIQLTRIKAFVLQHLRDPDLCVAKIAGAFHISNRYVHKLFEIEGVTVSEYIRRLRLENCCRDLLSERNRGKSITQIAFSWGFNSAAHFSYLFRQRYQVPASEYRGRHALRKRAGCEADPFGDPAHAGGPFHSTIEATDDGTAD